MSRGCWVGVAAFAVAVVVMCGLGAWLLYPLVRGAVATAGEARAFGRDAVMAVGKDWDSKQILDRASDEFRATVTPDALAKKCTEWKNEYGPIDWVRGEARPTPGSKEEGVGGELNFRFSAHAHFAKGEARVTIDLVRRGKGPWQIRSFGFDALRMGRGEKLGSPPAPKR